MPPMNTERNQKIAVDSIKLRHSCVHTNSNTKVCIRHCIVILCILSKILNCKYIK